MKKITAATLQKAWKDKITPFVKSKIKAANLEYRDVTKDERDEAIRLAIDFLLTDFVPFAGKHYFDKWEKGWGENLAEFAKKHNINALVPKYFGKYPINRLLGDFIIPKSRSYEIKILAILEYWIFEKYLKNFPTVYEFGCGTGHNLLRLREVNKGAELWGLDWATASQKLIAGVAKTLGDEKLKAHRFDFFSPDHNFKLDTNGAIFTIAALEQTGDQYKETVNYLLKNKPSLCVHIEPTKETLDEKKLLDYLSIKYFKKRNYLDGFIDHLKSLEKQKKVKIIEIKRSYIGSFYIDGYSIVIWKPL
jgi:hypothetical protein